MHHSTCPSHSTDLRSTASTLSMPDFTTHLCILTNHAQSMLLFTSRNRNSAAVLKWVLKKGTSCQSSTQAQNQAYQQTQERGPLHWWFQCTPQHPSFQTVRAASIKQVAALPVTPPVAATYRCAACAPSSFHAHQQHDICTCRCHHHLAFRHCTNYALHKALRPASRVCGRAICRSLGSCWCQCGHRRLGLHEQCPAGCVHSFLRGVCQVCRHPDLAALTAVDSCGAQHGGLCRQRLQQREAASAASSTGRQRQRHELGS